MCNYIIKNTIIDINWTYCNIIIDGSIITMVNNIPININMEYYKKIMNGENLLSPEEMLLVESELEKYNLQHM